MTKQDDLIRFLFEGKSSHLANELGFWIQNSPRFTAFMETYRDKIRKKARTASDDRRRLDLRAELDVANKLLRNRKFEVEYEPYASLSGRGADFRVTYRANLKFNIEVARLHPDTQETANEKRVLRIVLDKLGQMQANMANLLVIDAGKQSNKDIDLNELMHALKSRADKPDDPLYSRSKYVKPAEFYKDFLRLSAILFWDSDAPVWINKQAKVTIEAKVLKLVKETLAHGKN